MEKVEKKLLAFQIDEQLMEYVMREEVKIGDRIPNEFELAEMFGVGRSTIREAVKSLVTRGMLEVRRGSGTYVIGKSVPEDDPLGFSKLSDKFQLAMELLEVRLLQEPESAARAAERATEEEIAEIMRLCEETEALYRAGEDHMKKDIEFHQMIARIGGNRVSEMLVPILNSAGMMFVNLTRRQLMHETISAHRAIMEAIAAHDTIGARYAMIMHLTYNRQILQKVRKERRGRSV
ncbi:MAG: FCD domain-containing protein [Eubacteriales bacterium]|nr:FCD domain-containing protein [Eubacteriales bacterium]